MKLPPLDFQEVEPVGWAFENWLQENFGIEEEGTDEIIEEEEETEVIDFEKLEPGCKLDKIKASEWKENDHYAILGLQDIRFKATAKQIKQVHKALVLKFHPDKLGRPAVKRDEENFAIITKSADILSDPVKRRAFDSVDPKFNNSIPKENDPNLKTNFYGIFAPVFERNARWALQRSKVVSIGQDDDDRKTVDRFYNYWYDFKSWRDFHWEDEEDPEQAQDRYERRAIEKFNRVSRVKKKKEEMSRIRKLVDLAYANDPRIQRFVDEEKRIRDDAKQKKKDEARRAKIERELQQARVIAEQKAKEDAEKERLAKIEEERKAVAKAEAKAHKKERQKFRAVAKSDKYWVDDDDQLKMMEDVEYLCTAFNAVQLSDLNKKLNDSAVDERAEIVRASIVEFKQAEAEKNAIATEKSAQEKVKAAVVSGGWNTDDIQLLTKAMETFPPGTLNRWGVINVWMNDHGVSKERDEKVILKKAKELEKQSMRAPGATDHFKQFQKEVNKKAGDMDGKKNTAAANAGTAATADATPWAQEEQKRLEQALRTYGAKEPERWEKICSAVGTRTKRECMLRFKELAEAMKAKKLAMAKAAKAAGK
ncbi:unnamed protein product [Oikopleura dioica]|uniref:Uncharacterized protein n=1 Tax=Oikopleura dioica TaxID=34765 RepID=E4XVT3_OIKDI|nr:unnamed protein product [Oikopleura dioica]